MADATGDPASQAFLKVQEQCMLNTAEIANLILGDIKVVSKAQDYSFQQGKDMVSLVEALGAREVGSQVNPAGPKAAGT